MGVSVCFLNGTISVGDLLFNFIVVTSYLDNFVDVTKLTMLIIYLPFGV